MRLWNIFLPLIFFSLSQKFSRYSHTYISIFIVHIKPNESIENSNEGDETYLLCTMLKYASSLSIRGAYFVTHIPLPPPEFSLCFSLFYFIFFFYFEIYSIESSYTEPSSGTFRKLARENREKRSWYKVLFREFKSPHPHPHPQGYYWTHHHLFSPLREIRRAQIFNLFPGYGYYIFIYLWSAPLVYHISSVYSTTR